MLSEEPEGLLTVGLYPKTWVPPLILQVADFSFLPERARGLVFKVVPGEGCGLQMGILAQQSPRPVLNATVSFSPCNYTFEFGRS